MTAAASHETASTRYPAYRDSGIPWLGQIPAHWEISPLGYAASVKARLGWKGLTADEYVESGYIFLATPNPYRVT